MKNKLKPVICSNCKHFVEEIHYRNEGICSKDNEYTMGHRVCNKLPTDVDRRNAKLN